MLSIAALAEPSGAAGYFCEHRETDYYVEGGSSGGTWAGAAARDLGLEGAVAQESLIAVLEGRHPSSEVTLATGAQGTHRPGWDCTFSSPKSVSLLQAFAPARAAEKLAAAHHASVRAALGVLEREALIARRGRGGTVQERTAGLIAATFTHHLSRNLDPQLHTHCLIANLAPRMDGTYGAIESRAIYEWKMACGAIYRAELAARVRALGYALELDGASFRIAGVPRDVEKTFSSRRQEIEATLNESGQSSAHHAEIAALKTRHRKVAINGLDLDDRWNRQLQDVGYTPRAVCARVSEACTERRALHQVGPRTIEVVLRELTEQQSVFHPRDVYKTLALEAQVSGGGLDWVERRYREVVRHSETVLLRDGRGERCFSTQEMRALESRLVAAIVADAASSRHRLRDDHVARVIGGAGADLSKEQRRAVTHCCCGGDVAIANGIAGSGKSTLARVTHAAYAKSGYRVLGASLSGRAAKALESGSGIPSQTLHSLMGQLDRGTSRLDRRTVVVLDEAAMVGSRLMARFHAEVRQAGAKLILIGDARQLQPIEAGGIYNALLHRISCASLTTIRRQREVWAADAVRDIAAGRAERVLMAFEEKGLLITDKDRDQLRIRLVRDWIDASDTAPAAADSIMLAGSRADVSALNREARVVLRERGMLYGEDLASEAGTPWAVSDRLVFVRNSRLLGVRNGDLGTVRSVVREADGLHFIVDLDDGHSVRFGPDYPHIQHGYAVTVHKAQGATVEKAFVLLSEQMIDREWTYVAISRARGLTRLYCPSGLEIDLAKAMGRSHQKDTTLDYHAAMDADRQTERS